MAVAISTLDPIRDGKAAQVIADRLGELDSANAAKYKANATALQKRLEEKTKLWAARIAKTGVKKIITYHKTLDYFFDRFHLQNPMQLEPKPGIPPTPQHTLELASQAKAAGAKFVFVEPYHNAADAQPIANVSGAKVLTLPSSVGAQTGIVTYFDLFDASARYFNRAEFEGSPLNLAGWAKKVTGKRSMAVGGIGTGAGYYDKATPLAATEFLQPLLERFARGEFDLIAVGRALIGDAGWARKLRQGEPARPFDREHLLTLD